MAIPGLCPVTDVPSPDLRITLGEAPFPTLSTSDAHPRVPSGWETWFSSPYRTELGQPSLIALRASDGSYYRIVYDDGVDVTIDRDGTAVWVTWRPELSVRDVPSYLLGPV